MNEQHFGERKQQEPFDLEKRLSAYYGPPLRERLLSAASWQTLRLQLAAQEEAGRRCHFHWPYPRKRSQADAPPSFHDALARIAYEARIPYMPSMLRCRLTPQAHEPVVRGSWLSRPIIRLFLPVDAVTMMGQDERDVLLATGLARSICTRKPKHTLGRVLLAAVVLLASLTLTLFWMYHVPLIGFSTTTILCIIVVWLLYVQARSIAFRADTLMVLWLGRERVCRGLRAWADRSHAPARRRWGEPSLVERIERVCGTRVEKGENQLTLVR